MSWDSDESLFKKTVIYKRVGTIDNTIKGHSLSENCCRQYPESKTAVIGTQCRTQHLHQNFGFLILQYTCYLYQVKEFFCRSTFSTSAQCQQNSTMSIQLLMMAIDTVKCTRKVLRVCSQIFCVCLHYKGQQHCHGSITVQLVEFSLSFWYVLRF